MGLSEKLVEVKNDIDALITYANGITGESDVRIGDAVRTLADGYGADSAIEKILAKTFTIDETVYGTTQRYYYSVDITELLNACCDGEIACIYVIKKKTYVEQSSEYFVVSSEQFRARNSNGTLQIKYVSNYHKYESQNRSIEGGNYGFFVGTVGSAWQAVSATESNIHAYVSCYLNADDYTVEIYKIGF